MYPTMIKINHFIKIVGSQYSDKFYINLPAIIIDGGKGIDKFIIGKNAREITIENFEKNEKVDLSNFKDLCSDFQLEQAGDSVIVTIPQNHFNIYIILKGIEKNDLNTNHFLTNCEIECNSIAEFFQNFKECCFYEHPYICIPLIIGSSALIAGGCYSTAVPDLIGVEKNIEMV
jgi:hypothetical protein